MKDIELHITHYFFLVSIFILGLVSFLFVGAYPTKQFIVVIITAVLYVVWGIAHHHLEGDLHTKIVVEYTLIALLSVFILKGVLLH